MNFGVIKKFSFFQMYLKRLSASSSLSAGFIGDMSSYYRSPGSDFATGIQLRYTNASGLDFLEAHVPDYSLSWNGTTYGDMEARYVAYLYGADDTWRVLDLYVEIWVGGVRVANWHIGTIDTSMVQQVPSSIPLIGIAPILSAFGFLPSIASPGGITVPPLTSGVGYPADAPHGLSALTFDDWDGDGVIDAGPVVPPPSGSASYSGSVQGGWRWDVSGIKEQFATGLRIIATPSISCPISAPPLPTITTTDTWTNTAESSGTSSWTDGGATEAIYNSCWIQPVPKVPRRYRRFDPDYSALAIRFGLPRARRHGLARCMIDGAESRNDTYETAIPARSQILSVVGPDTHPYEDALLIDFTDCLHVRDAWHVVSPDGFHGTVHQLTTEYPGADSPASGYIPALYSSNTVTCYWDMLCNPHWSHKLFFQDWDVQGSSQDCDLYWCPIQQQWEYHSALPLEEQLRTRNNILLDQLNQNLTWHALYCGHGIRNLGLNRWQNRTETLLSSYTYTSASSPLWSTTDCSLAFGADIAVTADPGKTVIQFKLKLGSWDYDPRQWVHFANEIMAAWTTTGIDALAVSLKGIDNEVIDIGAVNGSWVPKPRGSAVKFAGSWGIDNGAGLVYDLGVDEADGISSATMADPERAGAFQLLPGSTETYLVFDLTLHTAGATVHVNYPQFRMHDTRNPKLVYESGLCYALYYNDGPGIRFGNSNWFTGSYPPISTPGVTGLSYWRTLTDVLCDNNEWLKGVDRTTNLLSDFGALFDSVEGTTYAEYERDTYGVLLPDPTYTTLKFAVGNDFSEVPPLCLMPRKERETTDWIEDGAWCLDIWSWIVNRQRYAAPGPIGIHLFDGATQITVDDAGTITQWSFTSHENPTDNDETTNIDVKYDGTKRATALPWHGYLYEGDIAPQDEKGYHLCRHPHNNLLFAVRSNDAGIEVVRFDARLVMDEIFTVLSGSDYGRAQIAFRSEGGIIIAYENLGTIYSIESQSMSHNGGWSSPVTVGTGKNPALAIDEKYVLEFCAGYDTDRWKLFSRESGGSWSYVADIALTATDTSSAGLEFAPDGSNVLVFVYDDAGTMKRLFSTNFGQSWNT